MVGAQRTTARYLEKGSERKEQGGWELVTRESCSQLVGFTSGESGNTQSIPSRGSMCSDF